jgi:hypothetical protein
MIEKKAIMVAEAPETESTESSFGEYAVIDGIDKKLIKKGIDLEKRVVGISTSADSMAVRDELKAFIPEIRAAEANARDMQKDPELATAYKNMRGDIQDLIASLDMMGTPKGSMTPEQMAEMPEDEEEEEETMV